MKSIVMQMCYFVKVNINITMDSDSVWEGIVHNSTLSLSRVRWKFILTSWLSYCLNFVMNSPGQPLGTLLNDTSTSIQP